ncbi:cellulose binding domain-containing protein [Sorangium sp. So ce136]|uniref:cellulose binding domain-containing protein n=1 Tax=Sorangium sp. So ce136 TaxID=3133284 RepID=UPI003F102BE4
MRTTRLLGCFSASFACFLLACSPGTGGDEKSDSLLSGLSSPDGTIQAELTLPSQWGSGYCASVTIKNTGGSPTTGWGVVIGLNGSTLNNAWNVRVTPSEGQFTAINEGYNGELKPGASTMWGFCGSGTGRPSLASVTGPGGSTTSTSASSSSSSSTSASSGGGEGGATGTGGAGGEGGDVTTAGAGGEGAGTTTTAGVGGEGAGTTTTTTAGVGGAGGEGAGTTTTTAGAGGEGAGTTTTTGAGGEGAGTTTTTAGAGGEGAGTTTTTAGVGGAGGEGGATTTAGVGGAGGEGGGSSSDPACGPDTAAFADVQPILQRSCTGCHGSPAAPAGLDLSATMAVGALVDQDARSCSSEHALVVPFMPSSSYLMNKLNDTGLCDPDESRMPPGTPLPEADIKTINDWICAGAPAD